MIIGLDLDNTIICYDGLFHELGVERGFVPGDLDRDKRSVRDYLKATGREDRWTRMQAEIYGPGIHRAPPYPGARDFVARAAGAGIPLHIISHKTRLAAADEAIDLHRFALDWLRANGFFAESSPGIGVFFAETRPEKIARIGEVGCTHFVDDLPEIFEEPAFPPQTARILFDPDRRAAPCPGAIRVESWSELAEMLF